MQNCRRRSRRGRRPISTRSFVKRARKPRSVPRWCCRPKPCRSGEALISADGNCCWRRIRPPIPTTISPCSIRRPARSGPAIWSSTAISRRWTGRCSAGSTFWSSSRAGRRNGRCRATAGRCLTGPRGQRPPTTISRGWSRRPAPPSPVATAFRTRPPRWGRTSPATGRSSTSSTPATSPPPSANWSGSDGRSLPRHHALPDIGGRRAGDDRARALQHAGDQPRDREGALFEEDGRLADILQRLGALAVDAGLPGQRVLEFLDPVEVLLLGGIERDEFVLQFLDLFRELRLGAGIAADAGDHLLAVALDHVEHGVEELRRLLLALGLGNGLEPVRDG